MSTNAEKSNIWLINELMDSDLSKALPGLTLQNKCKIAKDVARAMKYLHSLNPPVLHRDLKASNVLLKKDGTTKVCDFGVSRLLPTEFSNQVSQDAGTLAYMANEVWIEGIFTPKSDVYSYGILLIELFTGERPFKTSITLILEFLEKMKNREITVEIPTDEEIPVVFRELMEKCTLWEREQRPSFEEVFDTLKHSK